MKLKPWAQTTMIIFVVFTAFFTGWAIAPNIPSREIIGFIGISISILTALVCGLVGRIEE